MGLVGEGPEPPLRGSKRKEDTPDETKDPVN